jgi:hypothetical protein
MEHYRVFIEPYKAYEILSKLIMEAVAFTEVSRTFLVPETVGGSTSRLVSGSQGLYLEGNTPDDDILLQWLQGVQETLKKIFGADCDAVQHTSESIKEELTRLVKLRNKIDISQA